MPLSDKHPVVGLTDDQPGLADTAKEAWLYGLILIESARTPFPFGLRIVPIVVVAG